MTCNSELFSVSFSIISMTLQGIPMSNVSSLIARTEREKRTPHIKLTKYDVTVSALSTAVIFAVLTLSVMICLWFSKFAPMTIGPQSPLIQAVGEGFEPDAPISAQDVESPEDANHDSSIANEETSVTELEEMVEQPVEVSENAATIVAPDAISYKQSSNSAGSADGTGTSRLGWGEDRVHGGPKPEHRWIVEFADKGDLKNYAAQLEFFGIELAAVFPTEGRLVYLNNMNAEIPTTHEIDAHTARRERRLFLRWSEGSEGRREADVELFQKANIDASSADILHFYTSETETQMSRIEQEFGGHMPGEIRRTYFRVRKAENGYEFFVQKQLLK